MIDLEVAMRRARAGNGRWKSKQAMARPDKNSEQKAKLDERSRTRQNSPNPGFKPVCALLLL